MTHTPHPPSLLSVPPPSAGSRAMPCLVTADMSCSADVIWERQTMKRQKLIACLRQNVELQTSAGADRLLQLLPDPHDRSISKRAWELKIQEFRQARRDVLTSLNITAPTMTRSSSPRYIELSGHRSAITHTGHPAFIPVVTSACLIQNSDSRPFADGPLLPGAVKRALPPGLVSPS